jgi:sigma-B regulation protein RsbU (phosphoserine phosphatase)
MKLEQSSLMNHLMDNIRDNIYFMDRDGRIILINQAGAEWLGFNSPEEVIGKTDLDIFTEEHGRAAYEDERRIMQTGDPILGKEEKETWADGRETWVSTSKIPLRDDKGQIVGSFGISRDITEHKKAQLLAEKFAEENQRFREEIEEELLMAGELQKTFFPTSYPAFPESAVLFKHLHYASGVVGGDFCSIRKLDDKQVGILLCDVMGHGVRAALGTAIVRAMVEEISHQEKDPGDFLEHMNRALMPILRQGGQFLFATAGYMVLDVSIGVLRYANAGHPIPIRYNGERADWLVECDASSGAALAISDDTKYQTVELTIEPGDSVFMFTDGIYEISNHSDEEYGPERLLAATQRCRDQTLTELFPCLLNESHRFSAGGELEDDVCMVGFQFRKRLFG